MIKYFSFVCLLFVLVLTPRSSAQSSGLDEWKVGLQLLQFIPGNEFHFMIPVDKIHNNYGLKYSYAVRALGRRPIAEKLQGEVSLGFGRYTGLDLVGKYYITNIFPLDARVIYSPFDYGTWSPNVFVGLGLLKYDCKITTKLVSPEKPVATSGLTGMIPFGVGAQIKLGYDISLDVNLEFTYSLTDNLNYYKNGSPTAADMYYGLSVGAAVPVSMFEKLFAGGPKKPEVDSDGDRIPDADEELKYHTDPLKVDTDGDGLSDGDEVLRYHTDPLIVDTDGDGLSDGDEVLRYHTDPLKVDTDGDSLSDTEEILKYHTDPLKADTDSDGLSDSAELLKYHTDPLKADTDGDGLPDGEEVLRIHTDPLKVDTDGDGLSDGEEVSKYHTDPLNPDTDKGGVNDGVEVQRGTNPLDKSDDGGKAAVVEQKSEQKVGESIILVGVEFKSNSSEILPTSAEILSKAYNTLKLNPKLELEIQGHTDNVGNPEKNQKLSEARAKSVKDYLVQKGISADRLTTKGFGQTKPIGSNTTKEGKQKNRRIEFLRTK